MSTNKTVTASKRRIGEMWIKKGLNIVELSLERLVGIEEECDLGGIERFTILTVKGNHLKQ